MTTTHGPRARAARRVRTLAAGAALITAALAVAPLPALADSTEPLADRPQETSYEFQTGPAAIAGTTYAKSVFFNLTTQDRGDSLTRTYDLAGACTALTATAGVLDGTPDAVRVRLQLFADGALRHDSVGARGQATPVSIDVTGARELRLVATVEQASFETQKAGFGDASVTCRGVTPAVVTATSSATSLAPGASATLSGTVTDAGGSPVRGAVVEVGARENGESGFRTVRTVTTDEGGRWAATVTPRYSTRYQARVPAAGSRPQVQAATEPVVVVRGALSLNAQRTGTRTYRFYGTHRPALAGRTVALFRRTGGKEVLVARATVDGRGVYEVRRTFTGSGRIEFVARAAGDGYSTAAASAVRPTTVH